MPINSNTDPNTNINTFNTLNTLSARPIPAGPLANGPTQLNPPGKTFNNPYATVLHNTNIQFVDFNRFIGVGINAIGSISGIPQVTAIGHSMLTAGDYNPGFAFTSVPFYKLKRNIPGIEYQDFRNFQGGFDQQVTSRRLDGASLAGRTLGIGSARTKLYFGAASTIGAYSLFNRNSNGIYGAGWGDHGNIYALRNDFTVQSHIATQWNGKKWAPKVNPLIMATPFRGDRVQVIDYHRSVRLTEIYKWKPTIFGKDVEALGKTQDFIKFFFTGPNLRPGLKGVEATESGNEADQPVNDDAIVFRAAITSLSDTFNPSWTPIKMIGRADSNYHYDAYSRDISLSFAVYASDRDEMKPIWRKLNALAGYTAPIYNKDSIALQGPWLRFTIGDLYFQQPAFITSLVYTLHDNDTTWDINIEQDPEMMQVPKKIDVQMSLTLITNELPQKDGRFYTLAKRFSKYNDKAIAGNDNWLSDFQGNFSPEEMLTEQLESNTNLSTTTDVVNSYFNSTS